MTAIAAANSNVTLTMFLVSKRNPGFLVNRNPSSVAAMAITATINNSLRPINMPFVSAFSGRGERHVAECGWQLVALVKCHVFKGGLVG